MPEPGPPEPLIESRPYPRRLRILPIVSRVTSTGVDWTAHRHTSGDPPGIERRTNMPRTGIGQVWWIATVLALAISTGPKTHASMAQPSSKETKTVETVRWQPTLLVQLAVSDLDRSIAFYRDVLGFELESRNDEIQWARIKVGISGVTIGLGVQPEVKGSGSVSLNIGVSDLDGARALLESRGVVFLGDTIRIPGVVVLADFLDPDGNKIRLAGHPGGYGE